MLWRHGRTEWNADGRFQGQLDPPLDGTGRVQAAAAAVAVAGYGAAVLLSSDSRRALATAAELATLTGLGVASDQRLREIGLGDWEGLTRDQAQGRFPVEYAAWVRGEDVRRGDGETYAEVGVRAVACLSAGLRGVPAGAALVACTHGGTARAALGVLLEMPPTSWWRLAPLGNARWSVLVQTDHGWRLAEHNAGVTPAVDLPADAAAPADAVPADAAPADAVPADAAPADAVPADAQPVDLRLPEGV